MRKDRGLEGSSPPAMQRRLPGRSLWPAFPWFAASLPYSGLDLYRPNYELTQFMIQG